MPLAYKISNIVVSSSVEPEAFGRVSVEAQSMEKPILASNIGGSNETIIDNKTGFLYPAGNTVKLAEKLSYVLDLDQTFSCYLSLLLSNNFFFNKSLATLLSASLMLCD